MIKENKTIYVWCYRYKDTKELEPFSDRDGISHTRWQDGYGIFGRKKDLLKNSGKLNRLEPVRVEIKALTEYQKGSQKTQL